MARYYKDTKFWKTLAGGTIICAAFAIMMPDLIKYLFSISRLLLLIALIFVGAATLAVISTRRLREKLRSQESSSKTTEEAEPSEETP